MDLREMRYFLAMCQELNFTRAAARCCVTQPALTRGIQKLEQELGGPLFVRERGRTHLTALGRLVRPRIEDILASAAILGGQAAQHRRMQGAELRLGIMCSVGPARFTAYLRRFRAEHRGTDISLCDATPERLAEKLLGGELDAALMARPAPGPDRLVAEPLYRERYVVACAPTHPFAARTALRMRDMDGQLYLSRENCEHRDVLGEALRAAGASLVNACRSEREDWIQSLVAAGMGICFLPEYGAVLPDILLRPVEDAPVAREVCLVTVAGRRWSPPLSRFIATVRQGDPQAQPVPEPVAEDAMVQAARARAAKATTPIVPARAGTMPAQPGADAA